MSSVSRRGVAAVGGLAVAVCLVAGCSKTIPGTPRANPAEVAAGSSDALLGTTCEEYGGMTNSEKRAVIAAIAEQNGLVDRSPELWVTVAGALCTFAPPDVAVQDVLRGEGVR